MDIVQYIPTGRENAISRKQLMILTGLSDRKIRAEIHNARRENVILNLQDGSGYYLPDMDSEADVAEIRRFVNQETNRLKSIGWSLYAARKAAQ